MRASDIRSRFLEFFRERGHEVVPSSPVVPHDDPTLLFANAGMNQFKGVFTGADQRACSRAATSQKCIRAGGKHNDLENVGYTARHLTFFEMLGNFSFGDYFKSEACRWAWELVTGVYGIDPARLWITIYKDDEEARRIWHGEVGIVEERILGLGEKDNYWSMGDVGPCGPCSEIHFDRGEAAACGPGCAIGVCDCDRYLEIWNLVFMQFEQRADGTRVPLPSPSIDTGMGLERMAMVLQGVDSVYRTDLLSGLVDEIGRVTGVPPTDGPEGTAHRVIADHIRSLTFAIADGAFPSNADRGYVLRRILRRAARYGYKLGREEPFIHGLVARLADEMGHAYPEVREQQAHIEERIAAEEEQFDRTLRMGMERFEAEVARMKKEGSSVFGAEPAFSLHDTCGFPIDLTEQMCREQGYSLDREGFDRLMDEQRKRSRVVSATAGASGGSQASAEARVLRGFQGVPPTRFIGYRHLEGEARVLAASTSEHDDLQLVLDTTPFYGEAGGQVGDTGILEGNDFRTRVVDTRRTAEGVIVHHARLEEGDPTAIRKRVKVRTAVDGDRRAAIVRNHTATHLLHAALRGVLGKHVQQKGSLVAPERLRFDISHYEGIAEPLLREVEGIVQEQVLLDVELAIEEGVPVKEALGRGAMALFGEKYGDRVRVVEIPEFSVELCGGTHCRRTGEIGGFVIVGEGSVSSGVRRIEALTGKEAQRRVRQGEDLLKELGMLLKSPREGLLERAAGLLQENRELREGKGRRERRNIIEELNAGAGERSEAGGCEIRTAEFPGASMDELLAAGDALRRRAGPRVFILATQDDDGVRFLVGSSRDLPKGTVHCGRIAKQGAAILGGGGG
ncbi:MAG: alanine--tRNA ligase, partial [Planctomycetota bacterium]